MFKRNDGHLQTSMFDPSLELPKAMQERLDASWAGTFYREFFSRLDEETFEPLYSENASRPNTPVNQLVGFEVLKAEHGCTDEQAYDEVNFNLQVRRALGKSARSADVGRDAVHAADGLQLPQVGGHTRGGDGREPVREGLRAGDR